MINHIIIQAGGLGKRMGNLTSAKPKCLIPVDGKPIIFHLLDCYPEANFYIIVDYMSDVLISYIQKFRPKLNIKYIHVAEKGTCSGIKKCLVDIPKNESFLITWSDLIFKTKQDILKFQNSDVLVGLTNSKCSFSCRWKFLNGELVEENCFEDGVSGIFHVREPSCLIDIPDAGSFTDYLKISRKKIKKFNIKNIIDVGTFESFEKNKKNNRYFNEVIIEKNIVRKRAVVEEYKKLILDEIDWYSLLKNKNFDRIPEVISENPYVLSRILGINPFEKEPNKKLFDDIIFNISKIHGFERKKCDIDEMREVYVNKTFQRVNLVKDIIPFSEEKTIKINGSLMENPFSHEKNAMFIREIENVLINLKNSFTIIHGDCTFSNIIGVDDKCFFIDPRGYFGKNKYYGDPRYDWAKLYYSFYGNYDNINSKNYFVKVLEKEIFFEIEGNGWEHYSDYFFESIPCSRREIELLHILIWFSLCGYVIEDYSSIIVSYYKGVSLWNNYKKEYLR